MCTDEGKLCNQCYQGLVKFSQGVKNLTNKYKPNLFPITDKEGHIICDGKVYTGSKGKKIVHPDI